jgi:hypothetical protein
VAFEKQTGWRMNPRTLFFQTLRQVAASAKDAGALSVAGRSA